MGCGSSQEQVVAVTTTSKPEEWEAIRKRLVYSKSKYDTKRREDLWDKIDKDRSGALTFVEVEKEAAKVLGLDKVMNPDQLRPVLIRAFNAAKKFRIHAHKQASAQQEQHHIRVGSISDESAKNTNKNVDSLLAESIRLGINVGSTGGQAGSLPSPISAPSPTKREMTPQTAGSRSRQSSSSAAGSPSNHRFSVLEGSLRRNVSLSVANGGSETATNPLNGPPRKSLAVEQQEMASHSSPRPPLSSVSTPIYTNAKNKKLMSPLSPEAIVSADVFGEDLEAPAEQHEDSQPFKNFGNAPLAAISPFPPIGSGGSGTNEILLGSSSTAVTPPIGALPSALRRPSGGLGDASNPTINGGAVSSKKRVSIVLMSTTADGVKDGEETFLGSGSNHLMSVTSSGGGIRVEPTTTNTNAPQQPLLAASPPQALVALTAARPFTGAGGSGQQRVGTAAPPMSATQKEKFHQLQRDEFRIFLMYIAEYMELYVIFRDIATNNSSASGGSITITDEQKAQAAALDANVRETNPKLKLKPVKKGFFSSSSSSSLSSSAKGGGSVKFVTATDFMEAIPRLIQWGIQVDKEDPMSTFYLIDTSRSGTISFKEFSDWVILQHMETNTTM